MIFLGGKEIEQSQYLTIFELPELKVFTGFFEKKKLSPKNWTWTPIIWDRMWG